MISLFTVKVRKKSSRLRSLIFHRRCRFIRITISANRNMHKKSDAFVAPMLICSNFFFHVCIQNWNRVQFFIFGFCTFPIFLYFSLPWLFDTFVIQQRIGCAICKTCKCIEILYAVQSRKRTGYKRGKQRLVSGRFCVCACANVYNHSLIRTSRRLLETADENNVQERKIKMISYHKYKSYNLLMLPADVHMFCTSKNDAKKN